MSENRMETMAEREARKEKLYWALRTRPLTDEEMGQVAEFDYHLTVRMIAISETSASSESYKENEKRREFNDALLQQFRIRAASVRTD